MLICKSCGCTLTNQELEYLEDQCESCEWDEHERVQKWKTGAEYPELEQRLGGDIERELH